MSDIDAYLAKLSGEQHEALEALRDLIHATVPGLRETMKYKMPTFETTDVVCSMAAQKHHMALYMCSPALVDTYRDKMAHLSVGKGCIRFKKLADLPLETIAELLAACAQEPGYHAKGARM